ncbi:MAG: aminoacetone oxidase family FAD-binding enzyme, partial [Phycisphaerae bacterium]|nr:aminoacetone oxidase family FAD-binding enzyme [Phycisphaerae bacterium]
DGHWIRTIPGVAADAEVVVRDGGRIVRRDRGSVLCTHFGLSGPAVLDASRHLLNASDGTLSVRWLPGVPDDRLDAWLRAPEAPTIGAALRRTLPERLMKAACAAAGVDPTCSPQQVRREARARLVSELAPPTLPITGSRGDTFAEATAGGVPLREFALDTLESRIVAGLHACGEVLDVDGRIGGFNFQWAWSSGFVAGSGAANSMSR